MCYVCACVRERESLNDIPLVCKTLCYVLAKIKFSKKSILQVLKKNKKQITSESNERIGLSFPI